MCSLEVPDLVDTIALPYADQDVELVLVNPVDDAEVAYDFLARSSVPLRCALDTDTTHYRSYGEGDNYAPYPLQVVIDRSGVITYVAWEYDAPALQAAIDAALADGG